MKIALSAATQIGELGWYLARNLAALGHQVIPILMGGHEHSSRWRHRFLRVPGINFPFLQWINKKLVDQVSESQPDFLLVCKGEFIFPESIRKIRRKGIFTVNLYPDGLDELKRSFIAESIPSYDLFFTKEPYLIESYGKKGLTNLRYLLDGCDSTIHRTHSFGEGEYEKYASDVSLVGSLYLSRYPLLSGFTQYSIKIWGSNFVKLKQNDPLSVCHQGREVKGIEQAKVFQATKINLNPHHKQDIYGVNDRTYKIAGSGGFQLVSSQKDLSRQFILGEEIVTYSDLEDLKKKTHYYLLHDKEREEIARKAQIRAHRDHTYQERLKQMFQVIKQL